MAVVVMMVMMPSTALTRVRLATTRPVMVMVGVSVGVCMGMSVVMCVSVVMVGVLPR